MKMHCMYFDRIVTVTHCTSPIKVGATVGIAFLHVKPDDESQFGGTTFLIEDVAGNGHRKGIGISLDFLFACLA